MCQRKTAPDNLNGKGDFIQEYCNREERLNLTPPPQKKKDWSVFKLQGLASAKVLKDVGRRWPWY